MPKRGRSAASPPGRRCGRSPTALRPVFAPVPTAADWGVEVTEDVAGMVRQWRIEGYAYSDPAGVADQILGVASGGDRRFGMALCRDSAAVLGEDADGHPWC
ncbi:hypothetical protein [Dactylosporangium sp. NPDC005555]|uniref:hypothetical protein n=1 Tax=Dactylosporangium sp. NPDC005555 TaxID=3154889 RepID=UPI0033B150DE